jgi:Flp pilus assembly protein TadG
LRPRRAARSLFRASSNRRGAAVVEFAVVAPLLVLLLLGMIEVGRAMMIGEATSGAARVGARAAVITGATNAGIANTVASYLQACGIKGATTVVSVNGAAGADLSAAKTGDAIQVTVQAPMDANSWVASSFFDSKRISGVATFVKE